MESLSLAILHALRSVAARGCEAIGLPITPLYLPLAYILLSLILWAAGSLLAAIFRGRILGTIVWLGAAGFAVLLGFLPWRSPGFGENPVLPGGSALILVVDALLVSLGLSLILSSAWQDSRRHSWRPIWFLLWLVATALILMAGFSLAPNLSGPWAIAITGLVWGPFLAIGPPRPRDKTESLAARRAEGPDLPAGLPPAPGLYPAPFPASPSAPDYRPVPIPTAPLVGAPVPVSRNFAGPTAAEPIPATRTFAANTPTFVEAARSTSFSVSLPDSITRWSDFAPAITPLAPHEPKQIDKYRLLGRIGSGGMAIVYLGLDETTNEKVAVKVANPMATIDIQVQQRMMHEIMVLAAIDSPYIVRSRQTGISGSYPFIVMDYLDGPSLSAAVQLRGPVREIADLRRIAVGTASGLAAIHQAGYTHRDLKPGNIVMTNSGPVIVDLGIAKLSWMSRELTGTGLVLGTIGFVAPELHRGGSATPAADAWSWGATLAYVATGKQLFGQGNPGSTIEAILSGNRNAEVLDELAALDELLAAAVWDATTVEVENRPQNGAELLALCVP